MKICFTASSGGHIDELMMLTPVMRQHDSFIFTERTEYKSKSCEFKTIKTSQINRKKVSFLYKFPMLCLKSLWVILREKPDVIISTGALVTFPICYLGKVFGKRIIFIESISRVTSGTVTGKWIYSFADTFIVQWEEMLAVYPDAVVGGGIF